MVTISWTREAEVWLRDIYDYIAEDNPSAASRVVTGILEKADSLGRFPLMGHRYESASDREVRIVLYGHYRIAYLIKSADTIDILGVFHGALDIQKYSL